jgi:hypothetical protein
MKVPKTDFSQNKTKLKKKKFAFPNQTNFRNYLSNFSEKSKFENYIYK